MRRSAKKKAGRWDDHYTRKAKQERFPARSVYKLQEIQRRYRLIRKGDTLLDLGCYPGSWLLYAAELAGKTGKVVGIDLKPVTIELPKNVRVLTGDIFALDETLSEAAGRDFNGVISDMAPATTGIKHVDSARSHALCEAALSAASTVLAPGGFFVCKIFQGAEFKAFTETVAARFREHTIFKPKSSRKASKEIYVIAKDKND